MRGLLPRERLAPGAMYPAGVPDVHVRRIPLASGLTLRSAESGPATGAPVLLLHGWAASLFSFRHTLPALAAAGLRAIAIDLPGHGLSDKPADRGAYTVRAMGTAVLDALDALAVDRAALVGHSMGGALAAAVALRAPERVARLALLNAPGVGRAWGVPLAVAATPAVLAPFLPHLTQRPIFTAVLGLVYGRPRLFGRREVDEYWAPTQFPGYVPALRHLLHQFAWRTPVRRLCGRGLPILVVRATADLVVRTAADALAGCAEVVTVRGGSHAAHEERPAEVNAALVRFLGTPAATP